MALQNPAFKKYTIDKIKKRNKFKLFIFAFGSKNKIEF
jgi:hypothetical protein